MTDHILLTGASGQLGTALVTRLLRDPGTTILALLRAADDTQLEKRRVALAGTCGVPGERLFAVRGDVARPGLGLADEDRARVERDVTSIIHAAASVRFDLPAERAAADNIGAVESVIELARRLHDRGRLRRLDHISTAYVAGEHRGRFHETDVDVGQRFRNTYEWSKLQSELRLRAAIATGLPVTIHRPSVVVGESGSGRTNSYNVMYWPLKLYVRGWWRTLPGRADTLVDLVPVDWVADAMARLRARDDTLGRCFHLAAGDDAKTVQELAHHVERITGGPPVRYIDQALYRRFGRPFVYPLLALTRRGRAILRGGEAYMPYFVGNPMFDTTSARALLGGPPPILDYLEKVVRFAVERDFGERGG